MGDPSVANYSGTMIAASSIVERLAQEGYTVAMSVTYRSGVRRASATVFNNRVSYDREASSLPLAISRAAFALLRDRGDIPDD